MKSDGIVVTTTGGKGAQLSSKFIIHIDAMDTKTWKKRILEILSKTEEIGMNTIAMPALGTGNAILFDQDLFSVFHSVWFVFFVPRMEFRDI